MTTTMFDANWGSFTAGPADGIGNTTTITINFDVEDGCYFAHDEQTTECWNLPVDFANIDAAIAYLREEYPQAAIVIGDSAQEA